MERRCCISSVIHFNEDVDSEWDVASRSERDSGTIVAWR